VIASTAARDTSGKRTCFGFVGENPSGMASLPTNIAQVTARVLQASGTQRVTAFENSSHYTLGLVCVPGCRAGGAGAV